jgi:hypothetical protein
MVAEKTGIAPWLRDRAVGVARRFLHGGVNPLSVNDPISKDAARDALEAGVVSAGKTISSAADDAAALVDKRGAIYDDLVKGLVKDGYDGPDATDLALKILAEGEDIALRTIQSPRPAMYRAAAEELASKPTFGQGGRLGLQQGLDMTRELQQIARNEYKKPGNSLEGETKMRLASMLRQGMEDAVEGQSAAMTPAGRAAAEAFVPAKRQLGSALDIEAAARKSASQAAKRSAVGLDTTIVGASAIPAAITSGNLGLLAIPVAHGLAKSRGGSTLASALWGAGNLAGDPGPSSAAATRGLMEYILRAQEDPEAAKRRALIDYLRGNE